MIGVLHKLAKDAHRRAMMGIARGVLSAINDAAQAQEVQIELLDGETADKIERFQEYGFTSVPLAGAEAVMACVGGLRSHGIVIAVEDRRYRLTGLSGGEVAIHDDQGQKVHLKRASIDLVSPFDVNVNAGGKVVVTSDDVELGAAGGPAVARVGDTVDLGTGLITSGSAKVTCA